MGKLRYIIFALGLLALINNSTAQVDTRGIKYSTMDRPVFLKEFMADTLHAQLICTECDSCQLKVIVGYVVQIKDSSLNIFAGSNRFMLSNIYLDKDKQPLDSNICVLISRVLR